MIYNDLNNTGVVFVVKTRLLRAVPTRLHQKTGRKLLIV